MLRIGLISDTHGLLRPEVQAFLRGSDHIVHADCQFRDVVHDMNERLLAMRSDTFAPSTTSSPAACTSSQP